MSDTNTERAAWLKQRRSGIGGSDIAAICGISKWGTPLSVYLDKTGASADKDNASKMRGRYMENAVCDWYSDHHLGENETVHDDGRHTSHVGAEPWIRASYDRLVGYRDPVALNFTPSRGLEAKTDRYGDDWGDDGTDQVPAYYRVQGQWSMIVSGLPTWDFAVFITMADKFKHYRIHAHEGVQAALYARARAFWHGRVLARVVPNLSDSDAASRIAQLFPVVKRPERDIATDEQAAMMLQAIEVKEAADAQKKAWEVLKARLCMEIGEGYGLDSEEVRATWSKGKKRALSIKRRGER